MTTAIRLLSAGRALATCCCLLAPAVGLAMPPDVAIVAAATNSNIMNERFTDLRDVLVADGRFRAIDIISTTRFGTGTPTLAELQQYDAVIHWSNDSNDDAVALGNVMADYVDAGGGMVQAVFANTSSNPDRYLQGRWLTGGYNIIPPNGGFTQGTTVSGAATDHAVMAPPLDPTHPIFQEINDVRLALGMFDTGGLWGAYRPTMTALEPGAVKLAEWEDGKTAVAVSTTFPNRVELGFHPVSNLVADGYYELNSDTPVLIANALLYAAGRLGSDVDGDFNDDEAYDCLDIDALVSAIVSGVYDNDFDLDGDGDLDLDDRDDWLAEAGTVNNMSGGAHLLGDANLDGTVDALDYDDWQQHKFSTDNGWCGADFNADGATDGLDLLIWNRHKFLSADAAAVPEPLATWWLCGVALWFAAARRGNPT